MPSTCIPLSRLFPCLSCSSLNLVEQRTVTVEEASRGAVAPEEQQSPQSDKHTGQKKERDDNGCGSSHGSAFWLVHLNDEHFLIGANPLLGLLSFTAHPVSQDRFGVAWLHLQMLVVKLPVLISLVEVSVGWKSVEEVDSVKVALNF